MSIFNYAIENKTVNVKCRHCGKEFKTQLGLLYYGLIPVTCPNCGTQAPKLNSQAIYTLNLIRDSLNELEKKIDEIDFKFK